MNSMANKLVPSPGFVTVFRLIHHLSLTLIQLHFCYIKKGLHLNQYKSEGNEHKFIIVLSYSESKSIFLIRAILPIYFLKDYY